MYVQWCDKLCVCMYMRNTNVVVLNPFLYMDKDYIHYLCFYNTLNLYAYKYTVN